MSNIKKIAPGRNQMLNVGGAWAQKYSKIAQEEKMKGFQVQDPQATLKNMMEQTLGTKLASLQSREQEKSGKKKKTLESYMSAASSVPNEGSSSSDSSDSDDDRKKKKKKKKEKKKAKKKAKKAEKKRKKKEKKKRKKEKKKRKKSSRKNSSDDDSSDSGSDSDVSSKEVRVLSRSRSRSPRGMRRNNAIAVDDGLKTPDAVVNVEDSAFEKSENEKRKKLREECPEEENLDDRMAALKKKLDSGA